MDLSGAGRRRRAAVQRRADLDDLRGADRRDPRRARRISTRPADALIDAANEAGGRDNITVVLFRLEEVGGDGAAPTSRRWSASPAPAATARRRGRDAAEPDAGRDDRPPRPPSRARAADATPPRRAAGSRRSQPARRRTGRRGPRPGARGAFVKPLAALLAMLIVLFLIGGGGYLATRQLYFIGTNAQGIVTIYRGLPVRPAVRDPAVRDLLRLGRARRRWCPPTAAARCSTTTCARRPSADQDLGATTSSSGRRAAKIE